MKNLRFLLSTQSAIVVVAGFVLCSGLIHFRQLQSPDTLKSNQDSPTSRRLSASSSSPVNPRNLQYVSCNTDLLIDGQNYRIIPRHSDTLALSVQVDSIVVRTKGATGTDQIWTARRIGSSDHYHFVNAGDDARAINVAGNSIDNKADIVPWPLSGDNSFNDDWCLEDVGDGSDYVYLIAAHVLMAGEERVVDVSGAKISSGTNVVQYEKRGGLHQQFKFEAVSDGASCEVCVSPDTFNLAIGNLQAMVDALGSTTTNLTNTIEVLKADVTAKNEEIENLIAMLLPSPASCVPTTGVCIDTFANLQAAVSNVQANDVIGLCGIIKTESAIVIDQPNTTLCCTTFGQSGGECALDSTGTDRNLVVVGDSFTMEGIIFRNGSTSGINPVPIDSNLRGGNVVIDSAGDHIIRDCEFHDGRGLDSSGYGGNLAVKTPNKVTMERSLFVNGQAFSGGGAAVWNAAEFTTEECEFRNNRGHGLFSGNLDSELRNPGQTMALMKTSFVNNTGDFGGGFLASALGTMPKLSVLECNFIENMAFSGGAGLFAPDAQVGYTVTLQDNFGTNNLAAPNGECNEIAVDRFCYALSDNVP